jgi:hypothetical protein
LHTSGSIRTRIVPASARRVHSIRRHGNPVA